MGDRVWLVVVLCLLSVIVGLVAGILQRIAGNRVPAAIQGGAVAFGASMTLGILISTSLGLL